MSLLSLSELWWGFFKCMMFSCWRVKSSSSCFSDQLHVCFHSCKHVNLSLTAALFITGDKNPESDHRPLQGSNSLSLLTEISRVEAAVRLCSISVLQSLASGLLLRWWREEGNRWGWWWRSWLVLSGEVSEAKREESCCILSGGWGSCLGPFKSYYIFKKVSNKWKQV